MRVFVTGVSGFVGTAVVQELISAGHSVLGLARSGESAAAVAALGADVLEGSLADRMVLMRGAGKCDGVIHTAFQHDFSNFVECCAMDRKAITAMGAELGGSGRLMLVTHGLAHLAPGRMATEKDVAPHASETYPRASEDAAGALIRQGVHVAVVRLAPSVHGAGDHGFIPHLIALARKAGVSAYVGDGANRWPVVHRTDAARLYRLALEKGHIGGRYHGVAETGVCFKDIAEAIGKGLGVPVVRMTPDDAAAHFGWMAGFASMDAAASSDVTQKLLGWIPVGPGLLEDMAAHYFR